MRTVYVDFVVVGVFHAPYAQFVIFIAHLEIFLVGIKNKGFDYTEWRKENLWKDMTVEELFAKAAEFERQHPELIPKNAKVI